MIWYHYSLLTSLSLVGLVLCIRWLTNRWYQPKQILLFMVGIALVGFLGLAWPGLSDWLNSKYFFSSLLFIFLAGVFATDRIQRRRLIAREREKTRERELAQGRKLERAHHELQQAHTELKTTQAQMIQQEARGALYERSSHRKIDPVGSYQNKLTSLNDRIKTILFCLR